MEDKKRIELKNRKMEFNKNNYTQIKFDARKELNLNELLKNGAKKNGITKSQYILLALTRQLNQDGIAVDTEDAYKYSVKLSKKSDMF